MRTLGTRPPVARSTPPPPLGAIIVPTARPARQTQVVVQRIHTLADRLGAVLVLLGSREADPQHLVEVIGPLGAEVLAIDMDSSECSGLLPDFLTSRHRLSREPGWDTPAKRNLGLLIAAARGWPTVLFLDDDVIVSTEPADLGCLSERTVTAALSEMDADGDLQLVGWPALDFPDNSVVCHGRRLVGRPQGVFAGAGAMLVRCGPDVPFFAHVYNEDWLFQYDILARRSRHRAGRAAPIAFGGTVGQRRYEPFHADRAGREELGDVLGEGLLAALELRDGERAVHDVDFWTARIDQRRRMLRLLRRDVVRRPALCSRYLPRRQSPERWRVGLHLTTRARALRALRAAGGRLDEYDDLAAQLVDFMALWRADLKRWRRRLKRAPSRLPARWLGPVGRTQPAAVTSGEAPGESPTTMGLEREPVASRV